MNKYNFSKPRQDDIRRTGQILPVQREAKAHTVNQAPYKSFGFRIAAFDARHISASLDWGEMIYHSSNLARGDHQAACVNFIMTAVAKNHEIAGNVRAPVYVVFKVMDFKKSRVVSSP